MKDKNVAAILALFLGPVGVHRFYLGQIGLGMMYFFLMFTGISFLLGFIDFIAFLAMDSDKFDYKYNRDYLEDGNFHQMQRRHGRYQSGMRYQRPPVRKAKPAPIRSSRPSRVVRPNPFKKSGVEKYRDFDFTGAIEDFEKALAVEPTDVATHFNMACAYSLSEEVDKAFFHLDQAVANGFADFDRIRNHDALAYVRIQDTYDDFVHNGYRLQPTAPEPQVDQLSSRQQFDLLEQLRQLGELREKGLLTNQEFEIQKRKLLDS